MRRDLDSLLRQLQRNLDNQTVLLAELRDVLEEEQDALSDLPPVLSVDQTAEVLGLNRATVYRLIRQKRISAARSGRRVLVTRQAVAAYLSGEPVNNLSLPPVDRG